MRQTLPEKPTLKPLVLVTGGARGIGAATALLAARAGYAVAVNYRANSLAADEVVRQIRAQGGTAMAVQADVADEAQVLAMFAHIDAKLGRTQRLGQQRRRGRCGLPGGGHVGGAAAAAICHQCDWQHGLRRARRCCA